MKNLRLEYDRYKAESISNMCAIRKHFGARSFARQFERAIINVARHIVVA